jgi:hypothetical protein
MGNSTGGSLKNGGRSGACQCGGIGHKAFPPVQDGRGLSGRDSATGCFPMGQVKIRLRPAEFGMIYVRTHAVARECCGFAKAKSQPLAPPRRADYTNKIRILDR